MRSCGRYFWLILPAALVALLPLAARAEEVRTNPEPSSLSLPRALLLGVVEGATEYLPVSSTGHLLLVQHLFAMDAEQQQSDAANALAICIQSGAILAVVFLYFGRLRQMVRGVFGADPQGRRLAWHLLLAFIPVAALGFVCHKWILNTLFQLGPVALGFFIGAVLILASGRWLSDASIGGKDLEDISWREAVLVGVMQCLALWPGISRSLATILGCVWVGMRLPAAVEFSFLLGLITLLAATAFEGLKAGPQLIAEYGMAPLLVALMAAFVSAMASVRFMVRGLSRFGLTPFAYYRIALAIVCVLWMVSHKP